MMTESERDELYKKAIDRYGKTPQVNMVFEECGELITSIARLIRGRDADDDVITELADVSIMIEQMALIFGKEKFLKEKENKLLRLKNRLDGNNC